jgi:8-oxo-dGTP diphosphatase
MTMRVAFHDAADDEKIEFAVIIARHRGRWVLCRHRERDTLEVPGGHREIGESPAEAASRELREETGATAFSLKPVCFYSVESSEGVRFGQLFCAQIDRFGAALEHEIGEVILSDDLPQNWTYPQIQPLLVERAHQMGVI